MKFRIQDGRVDSWQLKEERPKDFAPSWNDHRVRKKLETIDRNGEMIADG
jgi:hypothetical protein